MRVVLFLTLIGLLPCWLAPVAQAQSRPPLVNLARLSIAQIVSAGANSAPSADPTHQKSGEISVVVRFSQPVTVRGVQLDGGQESASREPGPREVQPPVRSAYSLRIRTDENQIWMVEGAAPLTVIPYVPSQPLEHVREVTVTVSGLDRLEEIEIVGPAPSGVDLLPVSPTPAMPVHAKREPTRLEPRFLKVQAARAATRTNAIEQAIDQAIANLGALRAAVNRSTDPTTRANAWLALNEAADRVTEQLGDDKTAEPLAAQVAAAGVPMYWCDPAGQWAAQTPGYAEYLRLLPQGPRADEAWMHTHRYAGPRCGDFEGTIEEYEALIDDASEFLALFPQSTHRPSFEKMLSDAQAEFTAALPYELLSLVTRTLRQLETWDVEYVLRDPALAGGTSRMRSAGRGETLRRFEGPDTFAIQNESSLWVYTPSRQEYSTRAPNSDTFGGVGPTWFVNPVAAFRELARTAKPTGPATLETIESNGERVDCWVVEVQDGTAPGRKERWFIAKDSNLPLRIESEQGRGEAPSRTTSGMDFHWRSVNEVLPDDLFRFTPPAGAREVPR